MPPAGEPGPPYTRAAAGHSAGPATVPPSPLPRDSTGAVYFLSWRVTYREIPGRASLASKPLSMVNRSGLHGIHTI
jgi:hypothetical protein